MQDCRGVILLVSQPKLRTMCREKTYAKVHVNGPALYLISVRRSERILVEDGGSGL